MAIYHYHREIGKRHEGKNAVFAAAYIRGETRSCLKTGETVNYTDKENVIYTNCIIPEDAPEWAFSLRYSKTKDASGKYVHDQTGNNFSDYVWNQIELIERRKDAQLYFHDDIAIPNELSQKAAIELVEDFVKEALAINGIFCDAAIHWDELNPHVHILMSLRTLTETGFSKKLRFTRTDISTEVSRIREAWANHANQKFKEYGLDVCIDHRSNKSRGIDLIPTRKIGKATHMHGSEHQQIRVAENQLIRAKNYEQIRQNPEILMRKLAQEHTTFTDKDIQDEIAKYAVGNAVLEKLKQAESLSQEKLVKEIITELEGKNAVFSEKQIKANVLAHAETEHEFTEIVQKIGEHSSIIPLGLGPDGRQHFTTQITFKAEISLIQQSKQLAQKSSFLVEPQIIKEVSRKYKLNEGQQRALAYITQGKNLSLVIGMAGTGKTYLLGAAREVWKRSGFRVNGLALSGRASAGLEAESKINSRTIHRFVQGVAKGAIKLGKKDIIVMDEMGMTDLDAMRKVIGIVNASSGKFVGTGDVEQTQPISRGAPMRAMLEETGCVVLDEVMRQKIAWQRKATLALETQQTAVGLDAYNEKGHVYWADTQAAAKQEIVKSWYQQITKDGVEKLKENMLISFKNETVNALNDLAREQLVINGHLEEGADYQLARRDLKLAQGERVFFGKNDYYRGVRNGDLGTIIKINDHILTILLDRGEKTAELDTRRYRDLSYGYAATVHKMQSYTGDRAFEYIDSQGWNRHLFLVGSSRHRYQLSIMADRETFKDYDELKEIVSRIGLKDYVLNYPTTFALRRGFDSDNIIKRTVHKVRDSLSTVHDGWLYLTNYQGYIEKQEKQKRRVTQARKAETIHREAIKVADFCDNRTGIAQKVDFLKKMPGYELEIKYQTMLEDKDIEPKTLYLYKEDNKFLYAGQNQQGVIERIELIKNNFKNKSELETISKVLNDSEHTAKLSDKDQAILFNITAEKGYIPINQTEKIAKMQEIYKIQLNNSELARLICENYPKFKEAMEQNRISRSAIEKSIAFGDRHNEIKDLAKSYTLKQFYDPILANKIYTDFNMYYGHITSALGAGKERNSFINEIKHQAYQQRYNIAIKQFGADYQAEIKAIKQYLDLDYEISQALSEPDKVVDGIKERLHDISIKRNELAHQILENITSYEAIIEHFNADQNRLSKHQNQHQAQKIIKQFSELPASLSNKECLLKQVLAHKIKSRPRLYGIYINDFLVDGWKTVNLENWRYERSLKIAKAGSEFKESLSKVRHYYELSSLAYNAWQAAIKRRKTNSPNYAKHLKYAQTLSYKRDGIASELINNLEQHTGALNFERTNIAKLNQRASCWAYLQNYVQESSQIRKLHMAHYIADNLKQYGSGVGALGIYTEIKTYAHHYNYLHKMHKNPDQKIRDAMRLAEQYNQKRIEAAIAWKNGDLAIKQNKDNTHTLQTAKHLMLQRNKAAYDFVMGCLEHGMIEPDILEININYEQLRKASHQHLSYQRVMDYLSASHENKGLLAHLLLKDRSSYHFVYDKGIQFKELREFEQSWLNSQSLNITSKTTTKDVIIKRWNYDLISETLMANPESTYFAIFGEPKKSSGRELRYADGLVVSLTGSHAGQWFKFTEQKGGGPIQAIQEQMGLSFADALAYGANLAGLNELEASVTENIKIVQDNAKEHKRVRQLKEETELKTRIEKAKYIWSKAKAISGSVAERYLSVHRGITDGIERMTFKYLPAYNKLPPALILPAYNANGELTAIQRVFLYSATGAKNDSLENAKISNGKINGSAGIVQVGKATGRLYIVEGPENGATVAMADAQGTVLVSLGAHNLSNLSQIIKKYNPGEVIIAADNDGVRSTTRKITEKAADKLRADGIDTQVIYPALIKDRQKTDWNDVLLNQGIEEVKTQLGIGRERQIAENKLYYKEAQEINYTLAETYLRQEKGLVGVDLSDLRYHSAVELPDSKQTAPAIIVPIINQKAEIQAEQILYLDAKGKNIIKTHIRGNAQNCVIRAQKGDNHSDVYFADNIVDAKSIAVGECHASIYVSLDDYKDLSGLSWTIKQKPPERVVVTTNNFLQKSEQVLYERTKIFRELGVSSIMMAQGKLAKSYTHISINDALIRQKKIRGDEFIKKAEINAPKSEKTSLKDKLKHTIKIGKTADKPQEIKVSRPEPIKARDYYIVLNDEQAQSLKAYFKAEKQLEKANNYPAAVNVADKANNVYKTLLQQIRDVNTHPQLINRPTNTSFNAQAKSRAEQGQSIGINDFAGLLQRIAIPQLDKTTQKQFDELVKLKLDPSKQGEFEKAAGKFIKSRADLIKLWRQDENMPGGGYSFTLKEAKKLAKGEFDRGLFLGICKSASQVIAVKKQQINYDIAQDEDRTRGGRSR
jgi:ATP-dependent exoDNAse (exonuclease V) alpha subunit